MTFRGEKVAKLLRQKGIKAKDFFAYVYPERTGNASFSDIKRNDNPKADTIERIADLLQCPIDELFDRDRSYTYEAAGDNITADNNSTAFKGTSTCDPRLLDIIQTRDRQLDKAQSQLDKAQSQIDRLLDVVQPKN